MKTQVQFDTYPLNPVLDPSGAGCFAMKLQNLQIVNDDSVFEEVVKEKTLPMSPELLEFGFRCVLATMADRVSKDCRPRKVGNILKATPYLRGKLKSAYSPFDKNTCSCAIVFTSLSGLEKNVNTEKYIQFVNTKTGTRVIVDRIVYEGCVDSSQIATIMRGKGIAVTGLNCQWLEGDTCTLVWKDADGVKQTAQIVPISSTVTEMHFAWPEALNDAPLGDVEMHFLTRGGIADGEQQSNDKTVTLIEAEVVPTITNVATSGSDGVVKGRAFEATGANLGFNFATDRVSVKWTEGGVTSQSTLVPISATAEKIAFNSCSLFADLPDGTALEFTFEVGGKVVTKSSVLHEPGPMITKVTSGSGDDADVVYKAEPVYVHGENFAATQADTVTITKGDTDTWEWTGNNLTVLDADGKLALNYMGCKHNGEAGSFYVGDDPCELTVSFKGSTRTVQYKPARA